MLAIDFIAICIAF